MRHPSREQNQIEWKGKRENQTMENTNGLIETKILPKNSQDLLLPCTHWKGHAMPLECINSKRPTKYHDRRILVKPGNQQQEASMSQRSLPSSNPARLL